MRRENQYRLKTTRCLRWALKIQHVVFLIHDDFNALNILHPLAETRLCTKPVLRQRNISFVDKAMDAALTLEPNGDETYDVERFIYMVRFWNEQIEKENENTSYNKRKDIICKKLLEYRIGLIVNMTGLRSFNLKRFLKATKLFIRPLEMPHAMANAA